MLKQATGETAKQIFERAQLPNEVLGRIWNLADRERKGELGLTEFIIAMHLLASYRTGSLRALPQTLPTGLYEAASRRGPPRQVPGSRPPSAVATTSPISRHFSGSGFSAASNPGPKSPFQQLQQSGVPLMEEWAISPQDKETFDRVFSTVDTAHKGFITGDQAVAFFSNSRLPEDALAQIWDLADINSEGRLSRDEFAVAMFLIRQQRTTRDALPLVLPPSLVPPSMRPQPMMPSQPTAPVFDNTTGIKASKSASDDLFGLDAFATPATQLSQPTGGSSLYSSTPSPPAVQAPPQTLPQPQSSTYKQFVPSSLFGQAMVTPHATGLSSHDNTARVRGIQQKPTIDDLLGDNDPEVSKKLTQETTELANLSNQVSNLTGQMQEVKSKRMSTEQDLLKAQSKKHDFEVRLSQLRSAYEQEASGVRTLEERLASLRSETRQLENDLVSVQSTHQGLQNQRNQLLSALELDQRENANLKEQIRQTNIEINELKPHLEKLRSETRQQKGLVAINKKQLVTNEIEREKLEGEIESASRELEQATRQVQADERNSSAELSVHEPIASTSPNPPTASMNPFFRRAPTASTEKGASSPFTPQTATSPNQNAFDSFFGPALGPSNPKPAPPPTSFRANSPSLSNDPHRTTSNYSVKSSEGPDMPTPSDSPPLATHSDIPQVNEPPAPPKSRQITSSLLPLRNLERSDSTSSSVKVAPPGSRAGEPSDFDTPTDGRPLFFETPITNESSQFPKGLAEVNTKPNDLNNSQFTSAIKQASPNGGESIEQENRFRIEEDPQLSEQQSLPQDVPGAFPDDMTPPTQGRLASNESKAPNSGSSADPGPGTFDGAQDPASNSVPGQDDFDAAFEGFTDKGKAPEKFNGVASSGKLGEAGPPKSREEFPPIQEFGPDEDSDSDYDRGFDDDFTTSSPRRGQDKSQVTQTSFRPEPGLGKDRENLSTLRPTLATAVSNISELPTPNADMSPPTYNQIVSPNGQTSHRTDSNQFPAEYTGLLPSREVPTSTLIPSSTNLTSDDAGSKNVNENGQGIFGGQATAVPLAPAASKAPHNYEQGVPQSFPPPLGSAKPALDDEFENEFGDLAEAKEADDKMDDEVDTSRKDAFDDFNPVFDSSTPSRTTVNPPSSTFSAADSFHDFGSSNFTPAPTANTSQAGGNQASPNQTHDWDAIFSGLGLGGNSNDQSQAQPASIPSPQQNQSQEAALPAEESSKPMLNRVLSTGTEHDDPILKRLTGMGFARDASLEALEKFDYNIDRVSALVFSS